MTANSEVDKFSTVPQSQQVEPVQRATPRRIFERETSRPLSANNLKSRKEFSCAHVVFCNPNTISSLEPQPGGSVLCRGGIWAEDPRAFVEVEHGDCSFLGGLRSRPERPSIPCASSAACFRRHLAWTRHDHHGVGSHPGLRLLRAVCA